MSEMTANLQRKIWIWRRFAIRSRTFDIFEYGLEEGTYIHAMSLLLFILFIVQRNLSAQLEMSWRYATGAAFVHYRYL